MFLISSNEAPAFTENKEIWISIIVLMFLSLIWYIKNTGQKLSIYM